MKKVTRLAAYLLLAWATLARHSSGADTKPLWIHPGHIGGIGDSAFTTNFYLTVGADGMIKAWDARSLEFSHTIPVHQRDPARARIAISADERYVAHSSIRGVFILEIATGRLVATIPEWLSLIEFEAGSNVLVTTAYKRRAFYNLAGQLQKEVELESPATPPWEEWPEGDEAYSPDRTERATVGSSYLNQYSAATGQLIRSIALPSESTWHSLYNHTVAYSRDGKFLAAGAMVFDAKTGAVVKELLSRSQAPAPISSGVSIALGGTSTVAFGHDGGIATFDYDTGRVMATFTNTSGIIAVSPSHDLLMTPRGVLRVEDGEMIRTFANYILAVDPLWNVAIERVSTNNSTARVIRYSDGAVFANLTATNSWEAFVAAFSPDGTIVATGGGWKPATMFPHPDEAVRLWRVSDGALLKTLRPDRAYGSASKIRFSPDGRMVASVINRYILDVNVWAVETGEELLRLKLPGDTHHAAELPRAIGFFADKPWIAVADSAGVAVWDVPAKKQIFRIDTETQGLTDLEITPDGQRMVFGRADGTVGMLDVPRHHRFIPPIVDTTSRKVAVDFLGRGAYQFYRSTDLKTWTPATGFLATNDVFSAEFSAREREYFRAVRIE